MVRSVPARQVLPTKFATAFNGTMNWGFSNAVDGMRIRLTGRTFFMASNTGTGPYTLTIQSAPDLYGRIKSIVKTVAVNERWISPVFPMSGWMQSDAYLWVDVTDANLRIYSFEIPPN